MMRTIFAGALVAAVSLGSAAHAVEHQVLILTDAYFPNVTYVNSGDTIRFVNTTGVVHDIIAKNDAWTLQIEPGTEATMTVEQGVQTTFYDAQSQDENGVYTIEGNMSFAAPPIN